MEEKVWLTLRRDYSLSAYYVAFSRSRMARAGQVADRLPSMKPAMGWEGLRSPLA
jgi:hypothetical protein